MPIVPKPSAGILGPVFPSLRSGMGLFAIILGDIDLSWVDKNNEKGDTDSRCISVFGGKPRSLYSLSTKIKLRTVTQP